MIYEIVYMHAISNFVFWDYIVFLTAPGSESVLLFAMLLSKNHYICP
jgi:hypothetical protein